LVGFVPDGSQLVIEQRERGLVSGFHRLKYRELKFAVKPGTKPETIVPSKPRTVNLDAGDTYGYAFAADGKSFRTLSIVTSARGVIQKIVVSSVDAATGRTQKVLMTAEGEFQGYGLSPQGERLAVITIDGNVEVFDVDSGKKLWSKENHLRDLVESTQGLLQLTVAFSPDARRLVVCGQRVIPTVLNATTGESLPKLENLEMVDAYPSPACFSSEGRLLVLYGNQYIASKAPTSFGQKAGVMWNPGNQFLRVWDTATGKLLRQWNQAPTGVAFHPSKPILAIVERNGENLTRVGLWDFAAEPAKK
ncbi:MAG TPA: WD40 repeat domain-containing protein, partial [Gemmata sp.]|nr:WD40 repeat domain-containing protein [Gemmata sp.]